MFGLALIAPPPYEKFVTTSPAGKKFLADTERAAKTERENLADDLAIARNDCEHSVAEALAYEKEMEQKYNLEHASFKAVQDAYTQAHAETWSVSSQKTTAVENLERRLRETAPPVIAERQDEWRREIIALSDLHGPHSLLEYVDHKIRTINAGQISYRASNFQSIERRIKALRVAIEQDAEALKLRVDVDHAAELDAIYERLPQVERAEYSLEKVEEYVIGELNRLRKVNAEFAAREKEIVERAKAKHEAEQAEYNAWLKEQQALPLKIRK